MKKSLLLFVMMLASVGMWATTTFKLTQVSSVSAGEKYVFVQDTHAFGSTVSNNSALQTVTGFKTEGIEGTENYVWTLESAVGGYYMKNVSGDNKYLKNTSSTTMSFVASNSEPSVWSFDFTNKDAVVIQNKSNSDRFLGYIDASSYAYKAYATSNLNSYAHAIKVYKLEEEDGNGGSGDSGDSGEEPGGDSGNDPVVPENPEAAPDFITVWAEDFTNVDFGSKATTTDLTKITSASFVITPEGGATLYKNQNTAGGTAPEILLPMRDNSGADPVPSVLSVTINDLKSCYGNMVLTFKSNIADAATTFAVGSTTDGVTVSKGETRKIWNVNVPKGTTSLTLTFTNSGGTNYRLDDLALKCPGATCTIGQYGYATFSSTKALDLDNIKEGYTAYVATAVNGETVTIEPVSGIVPANTGLIIKGAEGTCTIPVSAEAGVAPTKNLLVAVTADNTQVAAGNYVLGVDNEEVKFLLVEDVLPKLNAGKSYLAAPAGARGRALRFVEGETNGINDVNVEAVAAPAKRIVNGKLVIEKAGKMFNAAGAQIK